MVICQYYLQGRCRFGQNCRYEHSYNSNTYHQEERASRSTNIGSSQTTNIAWQIVKEVVAAEKGGQWPLTSFAPFKEGPGLPGWEDFSPEEVRWNLYEAQANGTVNQCLSQISQLYSSAQRVRDALKQPTPEIINMINDVLAGKKVLSNTANTGNVFSNQSPQAKSNPFESKTKSDFRFDTGSSNIFGGSPSNTFPTQNIFSNTSSPSQNIFSNVAAPPNQNIFSNTNQTNQNIFSNTNQNIFSTPQQQPSSSSQNIFSTPQNQPSSSSQNIFSTPQNQPPSANQNIFLTPQNQPSSPNQNIFSTPQPANQSLFPTPTGNVFGSNALYSNSSSVFQNYPQNQNPNFGDAFQGQQNNMVQQNSGFPQNQSSFASVQPQINANLFGGQSDPNQASKGAFNSVIQIDSSCYSNMEDLTDEEMKAYTSPTFAFGKIPLKPPPQQYC